MDDSALALAQKHGKKQRKDKVSARVSKSENEKRRRAQENRHIEDIAELIADDADELDTVVPSEKPDKFAILEKADRYLQKMRRDDEGAADGVIQQSQVSSSGKSSGILSSDVLGALLLEVLDGFLFLVDRQGKVQFTSDQITQYLDYSKDELVGNSIYNIIDPVDHTEMAKSLVPLSSDGNYILCSEENMKNRKFNCRLRKKGDGQGFIAMQLQTFLNDDDRDIEGTDSAIGSNKYLVCVAQKLHLDKDKAARAEEFFITKQDLDGKILSCDTSGLSSSDWMSINLVDKNIQDFCQEKDRHHLLKHHNEVLKNGGNTSILYHFKLHEKRSVFVQTNSQLFRNPTTQKPEFIMSKHIVNDPESNSATDFLARNILGATGTRTRGDLGPALRMGTKNAPPPQSAMGQFSLLTDPTHAAANPSNNPMAAGNHGNIFDHLTSDNDVRELLKMFPGVGTGGGFGTDWEAANLLDSGPSNSTVNFSMGLASAVSTNNNNFPINNPGASQLHNTQVSWTASSLTNSISSTISSVGGLMSGSSPIASMGGGGGNLGNMMTHHHSPISPGFGQQRGSPGYAGGGGNSSQRSPGCFTPSPVSHQPQRSPGGGGSGFTPPMLMQQNSSLQALQTLEANMGKLQREQLRQQMQQQQHGHQRAHKPPPYSKDGGGAGGPSSTRDSSAATSRPYLLKDAGQTAKLRQLLENDATGNVVSSKNHFLHSLTSPGSMLMGPRFPFSKDNNASSGGGGGIRRTQSRSSSVSSVKGAQSTPLQSPRPRPSPASPPQQPQSSTSLTSPQSTSIDPDSSRDPRNKPEDNKILKELLESNDDEDDEASGDGCQQASSTSNMETKDKNENEAEPKKTDNTLLIRLLNESRVDSGQGSGGKSRSQLLQQLLQVEEDDDDQKTPTAESTSTDDVDTLTLPSHTTTNKGTSGLSSLETTGGGAAAKSSTAGAEQVSTNHAELRALFGSMWDEQSDDRPPLEKKPRLEGRAAAAADSTDFSSELDVATSSVGESGPAAKNRMLANLLSKSTVSDEQFDELNGSGIDVSSTPQPRQGSMIQNLASGGKTPNAPHRGGGRQFGTGHQLTTLQKKGPGRPPGSMNKRQHSTTVAPVNTTTPKQSSSTSWGEKPTARPVPSPFGNIKDNNNRPVPAASSAVSSPSQVGSGIPPRESAARQVLDTKTVDSSGGGTKVTDAGNPQLHSNEVNSTLEGIVNSLGVSTSSLLDSIGGIGGLTASTVRGRSLDTPPLPPPQSSEAFILQEASELEEDLCLRQNRTPAVSGFVEADDSAILNSLLQVLESSASGTRTDGATDGSIGTGTDSVTSFSQQDLESFMNITTSGTSLSEQQAINDIQRQLMSMEPAVNSSGYNSPGQQAGNVGAAATTMGYQVKGASPGGGLLHSNPSSVQQQPQHISNLNLLVQKSNSMAADTGGRFTNLTSHGQKTPPSGKVPSQLGLPGHHGNVDIEAQIRQLQQAGLLERDRFMAGSNPALLPTNQGVSSSANHPTNLGPSQPTHPSPKQGLPSINMSGAVRPALLLQQHQKRLRAQQMHARMLQQQQQQQRGFAGPAGASGFPGPASGGTPGFAAGPGSRARTPTGQGFPKLPSPGIPNNFSEIMNTTMAPNVSLERNQAPPGPMSPQFQQQTPHPLSAGGGPRNVGLGAGSRMPGGYNSGGGPQQAQWNQQANQAIMAGGAMAQANRAHQFASISPRQLGPPVQMSPDQQFSESPAGGGAGQFGPQGPSPQAGSQMMLSPQQQQQHMRARQMALQQQGLHSPHGPQQPPPQQPYPGNTGLVTPHQKLSPNNQISPQQPVGGGYSPGASSMTSSPSPSYSSQNQPPHPAANMAPQGYSAALLPGGRGMGPTGRALQLDGRSLQAGGGAYMQGPRVSLHSNQQEAFVANQQKSPMSGSTPGGGNTASKLVRQQLQGFLNTRVQQQQQQQTALPPELQPPAPPPPAQPPDTSYDNGELPRDVLDTINELSELGQGCPDDSYQDDLQKVDADAKERCRQFQQLGYQGNSQGRRVSGESAAGNLFRSQLLSSSSNSSLPELLAPRKPDAQVNVRGTECRPHPDYPKSQEQTNNSLLQQLLSDDS